MRTLRLSRLRDVAEDGAFGVPALLWIIIGVSVLLRIVSALVQGDAVVDMPGVNDQISYDALARRVIGGFGFSFGTDWWPATRAGEPTAHWSFLYTLYLAGVYSVAGLHPVVARVIQAVIAGILYPWFTWRLGRRLFGAHIGLLSAALIGVYAYFVYYAGALMTETFYILALLWAFDLTLNIVLGSGARHDSLRRWALVGFALALAVLLRQLVMLFIPFLAIWVFWMRGPRNWRSSVARLLVVAGVIGVLIAPWSIRNYVAFNRLVLLNTNAGYAFFWGNHPIHGMNFISILPDETYRDLIPPEVRSLDEAAMESALMSRGIGFVTSDPVRYVVLSLSRIKDYFEFWPSPDSGFVSNLARVLSFGIYLPFMLYGAWRAVRREEVAPGQWPAVILVYLFIGVYSLIHLLSWALVRYRLPVDAVLMPFTAYGLVQLASSLRTRRALVQPAVEA